MCVCARMRESEIQEELQPEQSHWGLLGAELTAVLSSSAAGLFFSFPPLGSLLAVVHDSPCGFLYPWLSDKPQNSAVVTCQRPLQEEEKAGERERERERSITPTPEKLGTDALSWSHVYFLVILLLKEILLLSLLREFSKTLQIHLSPGGERTSNRIESF